MARWKVQNEVLFRNRVFGGDSFIEHYPDIMTSGVELKQFNDSERTYYYIVDDKGVPLNDTCFFTQNEMAYLEMVR